MTSEVHPGMAFTAHMKSPSNELLQEALERKIVQGLCMEWKIAVDAIDPAMRGDLRRPFFRLTENVRVLGSWAAAKREISLSRRLVFNHPWDAVREVLLHEIAHQYADEMMGAQSEPPHGPSFREACRIFGANPEASGTYAALDERVRSDSLRSEDRILRRIRKIMALAQSKNRHEAEAAMAKSNELIEKYNVDLLLRDEGRTFYSVFVGRPALRHYRDEYSAAFLLEEHYFVECVWVPVYVMEKGKVGRVLEISGTASNVKIAAYVHDFLMRYIDKEWRFYNQVRKLKKQRRVDFAVGVVEGVRAKIQSRPGHTNQRKSGHALVALDDPLLQRYVKSRYPYLRKISRITPQPDPQVLADGRSAGRKMVLSKGIEEKGGSSRRFIALSEE